MGNDRWELGTIGTKAAAERGRFYIAQKCNSVNNRLERTDSGVKSDVDYLILG